LLSCEIHLNTKIYKYIITLGYENASVAQKSLNKIKENVTVQRLAGHEKTDGVD